MLKIQDIDVAQLINRIASEDRNAFTFFYDLYYKDIFRYAYYFLTNKDDCKEVVTNIFFSIWQSRKALTEVADLEAYLFIVTRNESLKFLKQKQSSHLQLEDLFFQMEEISDESPENDLVFNEMNERLTKIIHELPDRCRMIFLLARNEGLKYKEIAERMDLTESTVRVQMKIAIEKIVTGLKFYYPHLSLSLLFCILKSI